MINPEPLVKAWAESVLTDVPAPRDDRELEQLIAHERSRAGLRHAMAQLPAPTFAAALLHHTSPKAARDKVRDVERISLTPMSRRSFWDHLDRVNHFVAGFMARA